MFESLVQTNSGRALVSLTFPQGPTCQLTSTVFLGYGWDGMSWGTADSIEPLAKGLGTAGIFPASRLGGTGKRDRGLLRKLQKHKSPSNHLQTLTLHFGCGHSLRETVVRTRRAQLADLSDLALKKRLRKASGWQRALGVEVFREQGMAAGIQLDRALEPAAP